jgi:predicted PurR-regulated permease PerM
VHPLVVLLALVIAGTAYGVVGLLMAVPTVAAGSVLARHFWETRVPWAGTVSTDAAPDDQESWTARVPARTRGK